MATTTAAATDHHEGSPAENKRLHAKKAGRGKRHYVPYASLPRNKTPGCRTSENVSSDGTEKDQEDNPWMERRLSQVGCPLRSASSGFVGGAGTEVISKERTVLAQTPEEGANRKSSTPKAEKRCESGIGGDRESQPTPEGGWERGVSVPIRTVDDGGEPVREFNLKFQKSGFGDEGAKLWAAWFTSKKLPSLLIGADQPHREGERRCGGHPSGAPARLALRDLNFAENSLSDVGVSHIAAALKSYRLGPSTIKLFKNRIVTGSAVVDLLRLGRTKEVHLSHNKMDVSAIRHVVQSAEGMLVERNGAPTSLYPFKGRCPLWLRLEQNPGSHILGTMCRDRPDDFCAVTNSDNLGCVPSNCRRRTKCGLTPILHLTYPPDTPSNEPVPSPAKRCSLYVRPSGNSPLSSMGPPLPPGLSRWGAPPLTYSDARGGVGFEQRSKDEFPHLARLTPVDANSKRVEWSHPGTSVDSAPSTTPSTCSPASDQGFLCVPCGHYEVDSGPFGDMSEGIPPPPPPGLPPPEPRELTDSTHEKSW